MWHTSTVLSRSVANTNGKIAATCEQDDLEQAMHNDAYFHLKEKVRERSKHWNGSQRLVEMGEKVRKSVACFQNPLCVDIMGYTKLSLINAPDNAFFRTERRTHTANV